MCCGEGNCCRTFCKVLLIIVNVIFWLAGILMLAFGIAVTAAPSKVISILSNLGQNDFDKIKDASEGYFADIVRAVGIFMIVLGAIVFIIALFGFFGACCESKCMLITYVIILIIIVLAEVALIIFGAVFPDKFENAGKKLFYASLKDDFRKDFVVNANGSYLASSAGSGEAIWNTIQWEMECCGVNGPADYKNYQDFNWTRISGEGVSAVNTAAVNIPISCCIPQDTNKIPQNINDYKNYKTCLENQDPSTTYTKSCADATKDTIVKYGKIAIGIAAGIVGLELILITLAIILLCLWEDRDGKYV